MEIKQIEAAVEAVLFASGEAVPFSRLSDAVHIDEKTLRNIVGDMAEKRSRPQFGVEIVRMGDACQMVTKKQFACVIREALELRRNVPLTQASMETLALIAYNQPITKGYIEKVRGVDSGSIVSSLVNKGLVEERGRLDVPGRPILYGTTLNFLRCFRISSLKDLPKPGNLQPAVSEDGDKNVD